MRAMTEQQVVTSADAATIERLIAGDETTFMILVEQHQPTMLRLAQMYVSSRAVAEEVVQEAWLGVLQSLGRFEGRSSLKTWIVAILVHTAQKRAARERRSVPFASLAPESAVDEGRFQSPDEPFPGHWRRYPASWGAAPDRVAEDRETLRVAMRAIAGLPDTQQAVIRMRDIEGWDAEEVCAALDVSAANQRVLLHRARSRVRAALEGHLDA
jgi:RNA polymerase sigma-70 factor (ECF subfamily)